MAKRMRAGGHTRPERGSQRVVTKITRAFSGSMGAEMAGNANPILLYDGVCGLCNRFVQFVLKHDREDGFRFAALQSDFAKAILARHGVNAVDLDTVYLVRDFQGAGESLTNRSEAAIAVLSALGGFWSLVSKLLRVVPRPVRDWGYNIVAGNRYRIFGKYDVCPLPDPGERHKVLDQQ
jgi:predicted DCC family thiol-disulfide oxidoreductase YuxK